MANEKITDLPAASAFNLTDLFEKVNDPSGTPVSQKVSGTQMKAFWDTLYAAGTVTSVGLTMPTGFSVAGSPVTGSGTLAVTTTLNGILRGDGAGAIGVATGAQILAVIGTVPPTNGGTGVATVTTGDLLYGSAADTWSKLAGVATGNALISGGVATAPSWGKIGLTTHVSGTLAVGNGGTGVTTFGGTNRLLYTTAADTLSSIATANTSALVTSNAGVPAWTSGSTANRVLRSDGTTVSFAQVDLSTDVTGTLGATNGSTGQTSVTTGDLLYGSAANTWSRLADVATGNVLISGGVTTAPSWGKVQLNGGTTHIFGVLQTANGGTGVSSFGNTNTILFTTGISVLSSIAAANTSALVTSNTGVPSLTSGGTANRLLRTNGTTITFAQADLTTDVTGTLPATNGGTGTATVTTGDILYGSASNVWSKLAGVATGNALISGGVTTAPSWGKIGLTTHVSGTLAVGNGGTGATTFTAGRLLIGNGASAIADDANLTWASGSQELTITHGYIVFLDNGFGPIITSPDNTHYLITVDNTGALDTSPITP